jgi:hypothetical protein
MRNIDLVLHFKCAVYAVFAAATGAIVGGLFDTYGEHTHAQALAILAGGLTYAWRYHEG